jgi:predicted nucleic acid-binding protein
MVGADTTFLVELEVAEHPNHARARETLRREVLDGAQPLVLVPQVLAEFVHIVTDPRRFGRPALLDRPWGEPRFGSTLPCRSSTRSLKVRHD